MKEFINQAQADGVFIEKPINAISDPWIIEQKCRCLCERIREQFCICDLCCIEDIHVYKTTIQEFDICGTKIIKVGYGISIEYIDCCCNKKTVRKVGNVIFFESQDMMCKKYTVHIPNPPYVDVCCNSITVKFPVILCY